MDVYKIGEITPTASEAGAVSSGTNIIGRVGIDQTTSGTTNAVDVLDRAARDNGKVDVASLDQYTPVGGALPVISQAYLYSVAEGDIAGHYLLRKLGRASSVSTAQIDLCGMNAVIPMVASAMQMSVKSTSTSDDVGSTGATSVTIDYLDDSYAEHTTDVTMDGTTWVDTSVSDIFRIQSFHTKTVGTSGYAVGNITLVDKATRAIIYDQIDTGYNRSYRCMWTVPAGKTAYIASWSAGATSGASKYGEFILKAMCHDGVLTTFWFGHDIIVVQDGSFNKNLSSPIKIPATASIKISVKGSGTLTASADFSGWYE